MSAALLLSRIEKVQQRGPDRWSARCPAHDDKSPSLSIRELPDGRVLVHCFGGCDVAEIISSIGLELQDLFPPRVDDDKRPPREARPFPASDFLRLIDDDLLFFLHCFDFLKEGQPLPDATHVRLIEAAARVHAGRLACGIL